MHFLLIKKETLIIPFSAITKFYDPFVKFSIQLELKEEKGKTDNEKKVKKSRTTKIITLDDFRKKNGKKNVSDAGIPITILLANKIVLSRFLCSA